MKNITRFIFITFIIAAGTAPQVCPMFCSASEDDQADHDVTEAQGAPQHISLYDLVSTDQDTVSLYDDNTVVYSKDDIPNIPEEGQIPGGCCKFTERSAQDIGDDPSCILDECTVGLEETPHIFLVTSIEDFVAGTLPDIRKSLALSLENLQGEDQFTVEDDEVTNFYRHNTTKRQELIENIGTAMKQTCIQDFVATEDVKISIILANALNLHPGNPPLWLRRECESTNTVHKAIISRQINLATAYALSNSNGNRAIIVFPLLGHHNEEEEWQLNQKTFNANCATLEKLIPAFAQHGVQVFIRETQDRYKAVVRSFTQQLNDRIEQEDEGEG